MNTIKFIQLRIYAKVSIIRKWVSLISTFWRGCFSLHAWFLCDKNITYSYLFYCCVIKDTCSNVNHWFSDSAGWPTTQNPPPGFQSTVHSTAQHPEPHKISEGNTHTVWLTCVQWYNFFFKFTYSGDMLVISFMIFV